MNTDLANPSAMPEVGTRGASLIASIVNEVMERMPQAIGAEYNERYIDGGPKWGEHINYRDGGQHGQTHRNKS